MPKSLSPLILALIGSRLLAPTVIAQGPLAPPAAPAPAMKSLGQIDTRIATAGERITVNASTCPADASAVHVIAQRGSYFLTGNVAGVAGKDGGHITSTEVTLDLNGYQIDGATAPGRTGILIDHDSVTVRNGRVLNWGNRGIDGEGLGPMLYEHIVASTASMATRAPETARAAFARTTRPT